MGHTPRVDYHDDLISSSVIRYFYNDAEVGHTDVGSVSARQRRFRPESIHNPKDATGYRSPSYWFHQGASSQSAISTDLIVRSDHNDLMYDGAYGWPSDYPNLRNDVETRRMLYQKALADAYAKVRAQKVNSGVFLGEFAETAGMLLKSIRDIRQSITRFRGSNPDWVWEKIKRVQRYVEHGASKATKRAARRRLEKIPGNWLEVQYGWVPLMSDVSGALDELAFKLNEGLTKPRFSIAGVSKTKERETAIVKRFGSLGFSYDEAIEYVGRGKFHFEWEISDAFLASRSQLGLTNPVEVAWELVPFSFVVDWFYPVGNYLSQWDAPLGKRLLSGTYTTTFRSRGQGGLVNGDIPTPGSGILEYRSVHTSRTSERSAFEMTRDPVSSWPFPVPPSWKNPLSLGHFANAMSLLVQVLK